MRFGMKYGVGGNKMGKTCELLNIHNSALMSINKHFDFIYADPIYEDMSFPGWIQMGWERLKPRGIFVIQTDWHTCPDMWIYMRELHDAKFVSHSVWKNEWGNHPKNTFHQCFDDILIFAKGTPWIFHPERVQVPKVTKTKGLNPSGRTTKQATAWIDDICLTTTAKERIKTPDGHLIRWQKPLKLFDRIVAPFTEEGSYVVDLFAGSGSLGEWCIRNNRNYMGFEKDFDIYKLAKQRIEKIGVV